MEETKEEIKESPIEEVRLIVSTTDDDQLPILTFRVWVLGLASCLILFSMDGFFGFRQNLVYIDSICIQMITLPLGRLMAKTLPTRSIRIPWMSQTLSLNPGPFNMKEHVLIYIFASGGGSPFATTIITSLKVFYNEPVSALAAWLLVISTQMLGYGFAGAFMKLLVESPYMWWPSQLVQVTFYRVLHESDTRKKGKLTRMQFFIIVFAASFAYYMIPNYFFPSITSLSIICWIWRDSITAQQIGSGLHGLGIGSFALDWSAISGFLGSPLVTPAFAIFNTMAGFILIMCIITPLAYWTNSYDAKKFPIFSSDVFDMYGQKYNISRVLNPKTFELDEQAYEGYSKLYYSIFFPYRYGFSFAAVVASITHVGLFQGKSLWRQFKQAYGNRDGDIHNQLMKKYDPVPQWWFYAILISMGCLAIYTCESFGKVFQLPYWGILIAGALVFILIVPIGVLQATANQAPSVSIINQLIISYAYPGRPMGNLTFKAYGMMSMDHAINFLGDFKLGHYMKIPPKSMFIAQVVGTVVSASISFGSSWYFLTTVKNICHPDKLPEGSPWTCPGDRAIYTLTASWGLIGPQRLFYPHGQYSAMFSFFAVGAVAPFFVWLLARAFPERSWIPLVSFPLVFGAGGIMPPAASVHFWSWFAVGVFFNCYVFRRYKWWWAERNYLLSAGLSAGIAVVTLLASVSLQLNDVYGINWWGLDLDDHCPLATCPTEPGIVVDGCPVLSSH